MLSLLPAALSSRLAPAASRLAPAVRSMVVASAPPPPLLPPHLEDLREELESGEAQLFDVREPGEAAMGMLRSADLVPLSALERGLQKTQIVERYPQVDPARLTYVHCAAGIRVHPATALLQQAGFERVVPLQEGYAALLQYGFEPKEEE